jgi:hypothetical protein
VVRGSVLTVVALSLAVPAAACAGSDTISVRGSSKGFGRVLAIGDFKPERDPTYAAAVRAYGEPRSERSRSGGSACIVNWPRVGVRIVFANFGGGSACERDLGRSQSARAYGDQWRTKRGLRVGARLRRMRALYPRASRHGRSWWLTTGVSLFGPGRHRYPVLAATVRDRRIRSFKLWIGAAGD